MTLAGISLRDLEYVVAIADDLSFVAAARRCGVSQPSMSIQVRKVEAWAGTRIFERTSRRVLITVPGLKFVEQARAVLREADILRRLETPNDAAFGGILRLSAIATLGPYLFPRVLGPIKAAYPDLTIVLGEGTTDALLDELRAGRLDAALVSTPIAGSGLSVSVLFEEPFYLASSEKVGETRSAEAIWADLNPEDRLLLEEGHCLRNQALSMCSDVGKRDRHGTSLETLKYMVAAGEGATLVPALAVTLIEGVSYTAASSPGFSRRIALARRSSDARGAEFARLEETLRSAAERLLAAPRPSRVQGLGG